MPGPVPLDEIEQQLRERLGLFAKAEPPPGPPPTLFQSFAREALTNPIVNFMGPAGLGAGTRAINRMGQSRPNIGGMMQEAFPSAQFSQRELANLSRPLPQGQPRIDSSEALRRLNEALGQAEQNLARGSTPTQSTRPTTEDFNWARTQLPPDASLAERTAVATQRAIWRTQQPAPTRGPYIEPPPINAPQGPTPTGAPLGVPNATGGQHFDINRFRAPEPAAAPPARMPYNPQPGELGNFIDPASVRPRGDARATVAALAQQTRDMRDPSLMTRLSAVPNAKRGLLDYEQPIGQPKERPHLSGDETGLHVLYKDPRTGRDDNYYGVSGTMNVEDYLPRGSAAISSSGLPESVQGGGAGSTAYRRWIEHAFQRQREAGMTDPVVHSDKTLSKYSNKMYSQTLKDYGYDVRRHPQAYDRGRGQYPHGLAPNVPSGIYQVRPMTPIEVGAPPASLMDRLMLSGKLSPFDPAIGPRESLMRWLRTRRREE